MSTKKIPFPKAMEEITSWLDYKRIPESKREANKDQIENLAEAIADGYMSLDPKTFHLKHKLLIPLTNEEGVETVTEINYKSRLTTVDINKYMKGVSPSDAFALVEARVCALTGEAKGVIRGMDTVDNSLSQTIATFFL